MMRRLCYSFLLFSRPVLGVILKGGRERAVGQNIGSKIREHVVASRRGSEALVVVGDELLSTMPGLQNSRLQEVSQAAQNLERQHELSDGTCARQWEHPCPDGWAIVGSGQCQAPTTYKGGCAMLQEFSGSSANEKHNFASRCEAPWPCEGPCDAGRNYDVCPVGWNALQHGICAYDGKATCANVLKFDDLSVQQKQDMAAACAEIVWPCSERCEENFANNCPKGWYQQGDLCRAPAGYSGICSDTDLSRMSAGQKKTWASKCEVAFPCKGSSEADVFRSDGPMAAKKIQIPSDILERIRRSG